MFTVTLNILNRILHHYILETTHVDTHLIYIKIHMCILHYMKNQY